MNPKMALVLSGIVFFFISIMHLLRLLVQVEIIIAGVIIPQWVSVLGFIIPFILSICMFKAIKRLK